MIDQPIRIGVIGLGRAFTLMLPTFQRDTRVKLVAACDPIAAARDQFVKDFSGRAYDSAEALCADADAEMIYIASPHQFHAAHVALAAAAGKHVLLEKPMAITLVECTQMIADMQRAKRSLIVGHSHSFDAPVLKAREIIDSGVVGKVRMIQALNYTDFLYRPRRPEELRTEHGGGVIHSQAAHQIDVCRLLGGGLVRSVRAHTGQWDASRPCEGAYSALLKFEDGAFASLTYSGYGHFDSDEWMDWTSELGVKKDADSYGATRKRHATFVGVADEMQALAGPGTVIRRLDANLDGHFCGRHALHHVFHPPLSEKAVLAEIRRSQLSHHFGTISRWRRADWFARRRNAMGREERCPYLKVHAIR